MSKTEHPSENDRYASKVCQAPVRWAELTDYRGCDHASEREVAADWDMDDGTRIALAIYCEVRGSHIHVARVDLVTEDGELIKRDIDGEDGRVWQALDYVQPRARWSIREQIIIDYRRAHEQPDDGCGDVDLEWRGDRLVRVEWDRDGFFYAEVN